MKKNGRTYQFPGDETEYPVVEASADYIVMVHEDLDVPMANPKDPFGCALVCSWRRSTGNAHGCVSATVAYLQSIIGGEQVALKFSIPAATRRAQDHFDSTGEMPSGGFIFKAIKPSSSSEYKKVTNGKRKDGPKAPPRPKTGYRSQPVTFRNLTGRVHTSPTL